MEEQQGLAKQRLLYVPKDFLKQPTNSLYSII